MAVGLCTGIFVTDEAGNYAPPLLPTDPKARGIHFQIDTAAAVAPPDQLQLKARIERVLHVIDVLFPGLPNELRFRPFYVQLLELAGLGLFGANARPDVAAPAVENIVTVLIEAEGGRVKNQHLRALATSGLCMSVIGAVLYGIFRLSGTHPFIGGVLRSLAINPVAASCFVMIWIGCFFGVVLSYGARTTRLSLDDLIIADRDLLVPTVRLLFSGTLAMVLGIALALDIAEFRVGPISSSELVRNPMMAFLFGVICGISELALPGAVTKKAADVLRLT